MKMLKIVTQICVVLALTVMVNGCERPGAESEQPSDQLSSQQPSQEPRQPSNQQPNQPSNQQLDQQEVVYDHNSWKTMIPESCIKFFDGCNNCQRDPAVGVAACTRKACETYQKPVCLD